MDFFTRWEQAISNAINPRPQAYSRITRTPIFIEPQPPGRAGGYGGGQMTIDPNRLDVIPHESAHAIADQANLKALATQLAPSVPEGPRNLINAAPVYRAQPDAGSANQMADEGLGNSIGKPEDAAYVETAAKVIEAKHPQAAALLRRLNANALGSRKY